MTAAEKVKANTVCLYLGKERKAALADRARRLGYGSFSEFVCVMLDVAPDVHATELPRLRAQAVLEEATLAEVVRARVL